LVYIPTALQVKRRADQGNGGRAVREFLSSQELAMKEGSFFMSGCSWQSTQRLRV
jgi:hypothetical protein